MAEEHNCDIIFMKTDELLSNGVGLLAKNILENRIILWRKPDDKEWLL